MLGTHVFPPSAMFSLSLRPSLPGALWFSTFLDFLRKLSHSCWPRLHLLLVLLSPGPSSPRSPTNVFHFTWPRAGEELFLSCPVLSVPYALLIFFSSSMNVLLHFQMVDPDLLTRQLLHTIQHRNGECLLIPPSPFSPRRLSSTGRSRQATVDLVCFHFNLYCKSRALCISTTVIRGSKAGGTTSLTQKKCFGVWKPAWVQCWDITVKIDGNRII